MRVLRVIGLLVLLAAVSAPAAEQTVFRTYPLGFMDPATIEPILVKLAGSEGSVVMDEPNRRALVVATEAAHEQIAQVLKEVDTMPRNVRIDVRFEGGTSSRESSASVDVSGGVIREEGFNRTIFKVQPQVQQKSLTATKNVQQTLVVASGREGLLHVGENVPYVEWITGYGRRGGYIESEIAWQSVGSFLAVRPVIIGDGPMIRITLTPELRGLVDGNPYHVQFSGVSTEVVVRDGQTFQLGGLAHDAEFYSRFLTGGGSGARSGLLQIYLTPRIME